MITDQQLAARFEDLLNGVGDKASKALRSLFAAWQAGQIDTATFGLAIVHVVTGANAYGRAVGDAFAAAAVQTYLQAPAVPTGTPPPPDEQDRLSKAANTLTAALAGPDDLTDRLERLGRAEPAQAAQQAALNTYAANGVDGYTRGLDSGACELCVWLYKDGYTYPTDKSFHRHTGCRCSPIPTKKEN